MKKILSLTSGGPALITSALALAMTAAPVAAQEPPPIQLKTLGSFYTGGTMITAPGTYDPANPNLSIAPMGQANPENPAGQTVRVDHAFVRYAVPVNARKLPLVMWHGCLAAAWESTPDDREGFEGIFLRRGFATYVLDQPRSGRASKSSQTATIAPVPGDQAAFTRWRLGLWPNLFPGSQFPPGEKALDHFFRQSGVSIGPAADVPVMSSAVSALFDRIGPAILITHSASGPFGWATAVRNPNVKAVIAYEPGNPSFGGYLFPEGQLPPEQTMFDGKKMAAGTAVPKADFDKLTRIPINIVMGDNIPTKPDPNPALDPWRLRLIFAKQFVETVNKNGGNAKLIHLPEAGLKGNTHFPFSDLNNVQVADLLSDFLHNHDLDDR